MEFYNVYSKRRKSFFNSLSINTLLIIINICAFIIFSFLLVFEFVSINSIAIKPSNIFEGNYLWTFLTSMFMHGGFWHLFVNMFSLFFIGSLVQKILGPKRYLYFYLISGFFASLFFVLISLVYSNDFNSFAVGASGALFGLVGLLVMITPNLPVYVMFIPIPIKMKYAGPGLLFILWLVSLTPLVFGKESLPVGNTAHLGGLIAGLIYGFYLKYKFPNKTKKIKNMFS
jgi:uncharacterized protein